MMRAARHNNAARSGTAGRDPMKRNGVNGMGEAKRRNRQGAQTVGELQQRIDSGEFGAPGSVSHWCVVLDRSARGRSILLALRQGGRFPGLEPLFEGAPFRFWKASSLFGFVVLCSGQGSPERLTLLAADPAKLLQSALPTALARAGSAQQRAGVVLALDEAIEAKVRQALAAAPIG
ncbi:MAG: hypothetical protein RLZZ598_1583 [Pseudomonadota bacterium]|jgi:hypothetical protein